MQRSFAEIEALRAEGENSLARQMLSVYRTFNALAQHKYAQQGHTGLTLAHTALMATLEPSGVRIVTIAERMTITKQFAGRLVDELTARRYITVEPDLTDRRATLVKATNEGWQFLDDACQARREIEQTFEGVVGVERMQIFTEAIKALATMRFDSDDKLAPLAQLP